MTRNTPPPPNASGSNTSSDEPSGPSEAVERLISRRATQTDHWKRVAHNLDKALQEENRRNAEIAISQLEERWRLIEEINKKLEEEEGSFEYLYTENIEEIRDRMMSFRAEIKMLASDASSQPESSPSTNTNRTAVRKLIKLDLKKFNGDFQNWRPWWEAFSTTIHNNDSLEDVEKFGYLENYLEGQAAKAIGGLPMTGTNY